jgi:hypothetical protein
MDDLTVILEEQRTDLRAVANRCWVGAPSRRAYRRPGD